MNKKYLKFPVTSIAQAFEFLPQDFKDCFWDEFELKMKEFYKYALETCLDYEAEEVIGAKKYERNEIRQGVRNGYRTRKVLHTSVIGKITDFKVPRLKGKVYKSKILEPYKRRTSKFDEGILTFYVKGQSTRRIRDGFKRVFDNSFSHTTVSTILKKLQEKLNIWRKRKIEKKYYALIMDGIWLNIRTIPKYIKKIDKKTTKGVILTVMGITKEGTKEIIGFKFAHSEKTEMWEGLLLDLIERGLQIAEDGIIVRDDCPGLKAAIDLTFPYIKQQSCVFHFIAGSISHLKHIRYAKEVKKDLSYVFKLSKNQKAAIRLMRNVCEKWKYKEPDLIKYINNHFSETISYLQFPEDWHCALKTTNYLERTFRQINRKIYDVGVFPNFYSAERIFFLEILELNYKLTGEKPFYVN
jgi:putative transposase